MSTAPVIRYLPVEAPGSEWQKFYAIHVNGEVVGYVGTQLVTFEKPLTRTSRIVASRTRSPRWFAQAPVETTPQSRRFRTGKIWYDTRTNAVLWLLRNRNDALPQDEKLDRSVIAAAVQEARNFKKFEIPT